jgi:malate synthase
MMRIHIDIVGTPVARLDELLTQDALEFIAELDGIFSQRRCLLLEARRTRRASVRSGSSTLGLLPETRWIREDPTWQVASEAPGLLRRRVEITGPPTPTMAVNALNAGADVWMADLEDSTSPTWGNIIEGHATIQDAIRRRLDFTADNGRRYRMNDETATLVVRPRGLHLVEKHVLVNGRAVPASLFDFGLAFFHGAHSQVEQGQTPAFYLPKIESHQEARLWNDIFVHAQERLDLPVGTIRATVLIETIPAAFEMEEILFELRDHAAGLNAGRWDYIFSLIKYFSEDPSFVLPDRSRVTMSTPFMRAYTDMLVRTCHRRGAHAIGGMAAAVPSRAEQEGWESALAAVRSDKTREAEDGFDGSWVAHPSLVPVCAEVFENQLGSRPHQKESHAQEAADSDALLSMQGVSDEVTEQGVRGNVRVALRYLAAWLQGSGAVALDGLMEDAATVEIARAQLWQWRRHATRLSDGREVTDALMRLVLAEEAQRLEAENGVEGRQARQCAEEFLAELVLSPDFISFFTKDAYVRWLADGRSLVTTAELASA